MSTSSSEQRPPLWILVLALLAIVLAVNSVLFSAYRQRNMQGYLAAFIDKEALLKNTPAPRVILVGGSSVAFGYDSTALSQAFGRYVINMGLQGGLGIRFQLQSLKPYLQEGDIIIVSPEYHNILSLLSSGDLLTQMLVVYPEGVRYLSSVHEIFTIARSLPYVHTSAIRNMADDYYGKGCYICTSKEAIYYRAAFSAQTGDITTNKNPENQRTVGNPTLPPMNLRALRVNIHYLNNFNEEMQAEGIRVFFSYPSLVKTDDPGIEDLLHRTDTLLRSELAIPILDTPFESQYSPDLMYDTLYHLNDAGRALRTSQLESALCRADASLSCNPGK